ncbi:RsmB/NOP family class I SAM-dependent RNA methyltransferase [Leptolyngbya sp. AN02str]|uniref:RsmB/NOP family class I SAM-dependent RNA methyltransferase n=1 Tax=Leptolyngbya sp. AN02str TaxID=3423363 RepID=UPI003D3171E4
MEKSSKLLHKFAHKLFSDSSTQEAFLNALTVPHSFPPCLLWCEPRPTDVPFETVSPVSWQPDFVDRLDLAEKPGRHPWHNEGKYYCLDFSSVFAASVLLTIPTTVETVVDLCASPGGKSIFSWVALKPNQLLCNEVIGKRMGALISNLRRCHVERAIALSLDTKILAEEIPQTADVVLVDAPCTGQSLLAKGDKAPGCFHPVLINKNANRQKRILANAAQVVAPQGYLAYMTCAYSPEENEQVCDWFLSRFPQFHPIVVPHLADFQSHLSDKPCYRMFPQERLGAGAFTILLQNQESSLRQSFSEDFLQRPGLVHITTKPI